MKKLIFILVAFLFVAVSCQKEDIGSNSSNHSCDLCEDDFSKMNRNNEESIIDDGSDDFGGGITDPNNDEDEHKRKKKK